MKIKSNINIKIAGLTFLVSVILASSGCHKFLEENPTGSLTTETQFHTLQEADAIVVGAYRSLPLWTAGATDWGNYLPNSVEFLTGFATTNDAHAQFIRFQNNQVSGDLLDDFNNQWRYWYQGVRDCNFGISVIPNVTSLSENDASRFLGELHTLRAWYYFNLVRYFGDVVWDSIGTQISSLESAQLPRTSLKTIYDEIILPDLDFALNQSSLPEGRSSDGRVTLDVARAIAADVYLTCAGYPYQEVASDPTKDWCVQGGWQQEAYPVNSASAVDFLKKAKGVLDPLYGKYTLGTYDDLHDPAMNNQGEAIFQAQYLSNVTDNMVPATSLPLTSHVSMFGDEYGTFTPSKIYYDAYSSSDKRAQDRQMFYFSDTKSKKYDPTEGSADAFDRPYLYKYYDYDAIKVTGHSGLNFTFYRYADILLMLTEVNWSLSQLGESIPSNDVIKGINEVRSRALLPAYSVNEVDLKAILSERAYELVMETKMLWDQRRTRKILIPGAGKFTALEDFIGARAPMFNFDFTAQNLLSPVPGREIDNNRNCLQNFGYQPKQVGQ